MYSKDFKTLSLNQLRGKWGAVILAMLVSMLISFAASSISRIPTVLGNIAQYTDGAAQIILAFFALVTMLLAAVIGLLVGGCLIYGVSTYTLKLVRYGETNISYIFCGFSYGISTMLRSTLLLLLQSVFIFLWSLLLIIPGIIANLSYSQAFYILADNDDISALDAIRQSKQMMRGYKGRLFCLELSFIGWALLCVLTFGIGYIFLAPYVQTSFANFHEYLRGIAEQNE